MSAALQGLYAVLAVAAAGLFVMLASPSRSARTLRRAGGIIAVAGLAGLLVYLARWLAGFDGRVFFVIFAGLAVAAAVQVIAHPKPVYSALHLVLVVLAVTGLCILGAAEFLGIALVIVYGGAILVTYVFVIMLAQQAGAADQGRAFQPLGAVAIGFALAAATVQAMVARDAIAAPAAAQPGQRSVLAEESAGALPQAHGPQASGTSEAAGDYGSNTRQVGTVLFTTYVVAVEVAGVLLLVAMLGAIAIAQKRIDPADLTPEEQQELRAETDLHRAGREAAPY